MYIKIDKYCNNKYEDIHIACILICTYTYIHLYVRIYASVYTYYMYIRILIW